MLPQKPILARIEKKIPTQSVSLPVKKNKLITEIEPKKQKAFKNFFLLPAKSAIPDNIGEINATIKNEKANA